MADDSLKRSALLLSVVSAFVTPIMSSGVNLALPAIGEEFGLDAIMLSWVQTAYLLAIAVGLLPAGRLADLYGRRRIFSIGMAIFGLSSLAAAFAPNGPILLVTRALQGIGSSMIFATGVAILSSVYPPGERGQAMGWTVSAVYAGLTLGPFAGGLITYHLGWRFVMVATLPIAIWAWWVAAYAIKHEWAESKGEKFDLIGSLIYGVALVVMIEGLTRFPDVLGFVLLIIGLVLLAGFVIWENRLKTPPLFPVAIFWTNRPFAFSNLAALINYCTTYGATFMLSLYLQQVKGLSPQAAGVVLIAQPIMMSILSPLAGRLSDRIQPRIVASIGMAITALGVWGLAMVDASSSQIYIIACLLINGVGFGLFSSPNVNAIMSSVDRRQYSVAASAQSSTRIMGQMLSMGIVASVLAIYVGRIQIGPDNLESLVKSLQAAFWTYGILCVGGIFASLSRGNMDRSPQGGGHAPGGPPKS